MTALCAGTAWLFLGAGCATSQTLLAVQTVRAACVPTSESSRIEFQVVDQLGAVLPGVLVSLNMASTPTRVAHADAKGWVSIDVPAPGRYAALLELSGFRSRQSGRHPCGTEVRSEPPSGNEDLS